MLTKQLISAACVATMSITPQFSAAAPRPLDPETVVTIHPDGSIDLGAEIRIVATVSPDRDVIFAAVPNPYNLPAQEKDCWEVRLFMAWKDGENFQKSVRHVVEDKYKRLLNEKISSGQWINRSRLPEYEAKKKSLIIF